MLVIDDDHPDRHAPAPGRSGSRADTWNPPVEIGVPEFLQPLMDWVEKGIASGVINVPTVNGALADKIRDALAPVEAAPGSLNANYHYVARY